jgi:hypothetical protein
VRAAAAGLPPRSCLTRRPRSTTPPDTILVDEEIVAIIRAEQQRVRNRIPSSRVLLR